MYWVLLLWQNEKWHENESVRIIQIATGNLKIYDPNVRWRSRATFYELRVKNFQRWSTRQSLFVLLHLKTKTKNLNKNHLNNKAVTTSMLPGQQCVFVNVTWRDLDQLRAGILRWSITILHVSIVDLWSGPAQDVLWAASQYLPITITLIIIIIINHRCKKRFLKILAMFFTFINVFSFFPTFYAYQELWQALLEPQKQINTS